MQVTCWGRNLAVRGLRLVNDEGVTFTLSLCFDAPLAVWSLLVAFDSSLPTCRTAGPSLLYYLARIDLFVGACLQRHTAMVVLPLNSGRYISLMELLVSGYIPLVRLAFGKPSVFDYRMPRV